MHTLHSSIFEKLRQFHSTGGGEYQRFTKSYEKSVAKLHFVIFLLSGRSFSVIFARLVFLFICPLSNWNPVSLSGCNNRSIVWNCTCLANYYTHIRVNYCTFARFFVWHAIVTICTKLCRINIDLQTFQP